ncbi:LamG domain-containing protein [Maribellus sp. CM-23]|uniref:LamG domain-containing protein n=1 Tax=Maribellus sp. CM-23 TaxID=2781026 RepID=UPI001F1627B8|nr:LamG domain-containing protein [Maribellus sp. CM-23]MCE4564559.1 LamG domain-containing protein [Maribellus sp. CM-23]
MKTNYFIFSILILMIISVGCEIEGPEGKKSLLDFVSEPAGNNCSSGGYKVLSGIDLNNNNILDHNEIEVIKYICNGENGINSLLSMIPEPAGENCEAGGFRIDYGKDLNNNGILDEFEIEDFVFVCNGVDECVYSGLIAYYPFNGNANDIINQHNGTENGVQLTTDRNGKANSAYFFNGNSNIIVQDHDFFSNLDAFSVCLWVYPTALNDTHNTIISKVTPQRDFDLKIRKSNLLYNCRFVHDYPSVHYICDSKETAKLNTWTHLVCQWTGTKLQIFINGVLSNENDFTGKVPPWTGTIMTIGSMGSAEYFSGKIDDVRIYDKVLSEHEIQLIYEYAK